MAVPSGPGVNLEVLVLFVDNQSRDLVLGSAAKLAPFIDGDGKPTAGLRIEVPPHLQQEFRLLFKYGQGLRARHGPGTRTHVKFFEEDLSLFLNVRLPDDESWSRVSIEMARRGLKARSRKNEGDLERRLDIAGTPRPRAASASVTGTAMEGSPEMSVWTTRRSGSTSA